MRGRGESRTACGASSEDRVPIATLNFQISSLNSHRWELSVESSDLSLSLFLNRLGLAREGGDQFVAAVDQLLARPPAVRRADRIFTEERERDRRVAIGDDGVGQHAGI